MNPAVVIKYGKTTLKREKDLLSNMEKTHQLVRELYK